MAAYRTPKWFSSCVMSNEEAMHASVRSGMTVASGFATSEPHTFYEGLWEHIRRDDIVELDIRQALFMHPYNVCLGSALKARGVFDLFGVKPFFSVLDDVNNATKKLDGLGRLIAHYEELKQRQISFTSPFIGPVTNAVIPDNPITRIRYPEYVGRNTTRMGITRMQSIHFPDAVDSMGYDPDDVPMVDTFVAVMTPPNEAGEMSHAVANGANGEIIDKILKFKNINLLLYINDSYPFTRGYNEVRNTVHIDEFKDLAKVGRLFVVEDHGEIPALDAGAFDNPSPAEQKIAENVVNHIEMNSRFTYGRAIQVGFGGTGVLAIKGLKNSSWTGRCYTEMLEPFTVDLWEAGKIAGSHFIEENGTRTMLDGKLVCTFTISTRGSDFYKKLDNNPNVIVAPASRVVIPEGFNFGMGINNCLSIDFQGQINSGGRDQNHFSGVGGGATINRGLSKGGIGYFCLKSTHTTPEGKTRSSIFPYHPMGTPISYIGPDIQGGRSGARFFLVTEYGVTQLSGRDQHKLIRGLVSVADPAFRDELRQQAWQEFRVTF